MIDVELPEGDGVPELVRSFATCLASVTETPVAEVPLPPTDLPGAFAHWRSWFAGRGEGLVTIATPASFNWPGYWLAVLGEPRRPDSTAEDATAVLMFGTPSGVVLSPQDPKLLGRAATDLPIRAGYVLSGLDPASINATSPPRPTLSGTVEIIALAEQATGDMHVVEHAKAFANRGLEGDRYAAKAGTFTPANNTIRGYDLTLIEAEVLDILSLPDGNRIAYAAARRNIVTNGYQAAGNNEGLDQTEYLKIVDVWIKHFKVSGAGTEAAHKAALQWSLSRGARSASPPKAPSEP